MHNNSPSLVPISIIVGATLVAVSILYRFSPSYGGVNGALTKNAATATAQQRQALQATPIVTDEEVTPSVGVELPVVWGDLGQKLGKAGVIDVSKFQALYDQRGGLPADQQTLLSGVSTGKLRITPANAGLVLNLLWALGLGQSDPILKSEMMDPKYGSAGSFASTGGWTIAVGNAMDHYGYHSFFTLTDDEQARVDEVSRNVYRPCCNNSTHFPDCNHGMAMLGLLELMASQGASVQDMYRAAFVANSYWFPDQYATIHAYMKQKGIAWNSVDPKTVLGADYSSSSGFARIASQVTTPVQSQGSGGGCGVDAGAPVPAVVPARQSGGGCGI